MPPEYRLRGVLKGLLRSYGFRCTDVRAETTLVAERPLTEQPQTKGTPDAK